MLLDLWALLQSLAAAAEAGTRATVDDERTSTATIDETAVSTATVSEEVQS